MGLGFRGIRVFGHIGLGVQRCVRGAGARCFEVFGSARPTSASHAASVTRSRV